MFGLGFAREWYEDAGGSGCIDPRFLDLGTRWG
jgi:hypothetical protein